MGVHGLWDLLAPVGRRVSVETLAGKRLAIDASIWMVQFMKAMRDEKGEMVRNAHLLGFFRRICKLLFLRTKPVFVFDGGTPALKRRTVIARRRQRENAQAKIRKTAEKLFLNQIKAMRLSNLAENLKDQTRTGNSKGKEVMVEQSDRMEKYDAGLGVKNQESLDEMLAASIAAEECGEFGSAASNPDAPCGNASAFTSTSTSAAGTAADAVEDEDSDDEEMLMPVTDGNVDPAVLASLPPSMQLDLLVQMRERLMAENRQKYQKVKKAPQKFSELQIEAYLKTVAFRREIDEVQRAASGRGVGGVQTSRIASEANREFIFSSSFSGDKQALASSGGENFSEKQQLEKKKSLSNNFNAIAASNSKASAEVGPAADEVETYVDERGRKRIHRSRAMGIRMTRDLQRNIDLMKESEHEMTTAINETGEQMEPDSVGLSECFVCEGQFSAATKELNYDHNTQKSQLETDANQDPLKTENPIKISFSDEGKSVDEDDTFFTRLVAGSPVNVYSDDNSASDIEWEDATSIEQSRSLSDRNKPETNLSHAEDANKSESDVEWEEVPNIANGKLEGNTFHVDNHKDNEIRVEHKEWNTKDFGELQQIMADGPKAVSKGSAEEEFALQEAIRRSLDDITGETSIVSLNLEKSKTRSSMLQLGSNGPQPASKSEEVLEGIALSQSLVSENDHSSLSAAKDAYVPSTSDKHLESEVDDACRTVLSTSVKDACASITSDKDSESAVDDAGRTVLNTSEDTKNLHFQLPKTSAKSVEVGYLGNDGSGVPAVTTIAEGNKNSPSVALTDDITNVEVTTGTSDLSIRHGGPATELQTSQADIQRKAAEDNSGFDNLLERGPDVQINAPYDEGISDEILAAALEDELLMLGKEYKDLENEQKKLERNADSVNSEMFVECQELLQMFGLPYIIAPMEAEAQCAFLELSNLVDGVVTDDSDVFLFGARSVFKNIFDDRKYVETYLLKDIESELGLNTDKLICMALLLGSDYTEGVSGIGIVNAIEVVNAFPEDGGLHEFREWVESPDPTILGKVGLQSDLSANNGSKGTSSADCNTLEESEDDEKRRRKQIFMNKHRNISKNWHLPASFPSDAVISAYKSPQVDKSADPFGWGKPDLFSLRRLCSEKFAWANQKADELLLPVLKEYNKHETQLRLEAFYSFNEKFANIRSKRIRQAVKGITGKRSLADTDDLQKIPKQVKKKGESTSNKDNTKNKDDIGERSPSKRSKSKKIADGAGRSRAKGNSSRKAIRKGREVESSDSELDKTSTDNLIGSSDEHEHVPQPEQAPLLRSVRRSKRTRRATSYVEKDDESDELTKSPTRISEKYTDDTTEQHKSSDSQKVHKVDITEPSRQLEVTPEEGGFCEDYLFKGGGFCADEDNADLTINQAGPIQSEDVTVDDNEYLQMGGGFCTDDAENLDHAGEASVPNRSQSSVNPSGEHNSLDVSPSTVMQTGGEHHTPLPVGAFSDIPLLKRKKRKM